MITDDLHTLASARHRFDALPWIRAQQTLAGERIQAGKFPQAALVTGLPGLGRHYLAEAIASMLLCLDSRAEGACGVCRSCRLLLSNSHPDYQQLIPEAEGKAIRIDQIREAETYIYSSPRIAERRCLIVSPAERLNINAANALLKTLEEPPANSYLILIAADGSRLLPTLRSRCIRLPLLAPDRQVALTWLRRITELESCSEDQLRMALVQADNAPLRARQLLNEGGLEQNQQIIDDWRAVLRGTRDVFSVAADWSQIPFPEAAEVLGASLLAQARESTWNLPTQRLFALYTRLLEGWKGHHEGRHLNLQLFWESWLMQSKSG